MFALFAGEAHYPAGGWDDLIGAYATENEARARFALGSDPNGEYNSDFEWGQIVNLKHQLLVLVWAYVDHRSIGGDLHMDWVSRKYDED